MNQVYLDTARLLTQVAPLVLEGDIFALKGGTAINLFVRDMPRLSVDLDLVFVDYRPDRDEALARINEAIRSAVGRLKKRGFQTHAATAADANIWSNCLASDGSSAISNGWRRQIQKNSEHKRRNWKRCSIKMFDRGHYSSSPHP